jgi:hypothetical protein
MKTIYVAHSKDFDYKHELYSPLRSSDLNSRYEIVFPHETDQFIKSKEIIQRSQLVIAEVSFPAIGEGIELGWADSFGIPIICLYKEGIMPSRSLQVVARTVISYTDAADMLSKIENLLSRDDFPIYQVAE